MVSAVDSVLLSNIVRELFFCFFDVLGGTGARRENSTQLPRILSSNTFFRSVRCLMPEESLNAGIIFPFPFPSEFQLSGVFDGPAASSVRCRF